MRRAISTSSTMWPDKVIRQFNSVPVVNPSESDFHGPYNKLLCTLFPADSDFAVPTGNACRIPVVRLISLSPLRSTWKTSRFSSWSSGLPPTLTLCRNVRQQTTRLGSIDRSHRHVVHSIILLSEQSTYL